jgi:hypothetical protein
MAFGRTRDIKRRLAAAEPYSEEQLTLQAQLQDRQLRGPLYAVWGLTALGIAALVASGNAACVLLPILFFGLPWTFAIRRTQRRSRRTFDDRRAQLAAFHAGDPGAAPKIDRGQPEPFSEAELEWAFTKGKRSVFIWIAVFWVAAASMIWTYDASPVMAAGPVVGASVITWVGLRSLRNLPEKQEQARQALRDFHARSDAVSASEG